MNERQFQFEWDEAKAEASVRKHGVPFELACTVFNDMRLLTVADLDHSETEERWFSVGCAGSGAILSVFYLWFEGDSVTTIRLYSARKATRSEVHRYQEGL